MAYGDRPGGAPTRRRKPPKPSAAAIAKAQARGYASQGRQIEHAANRQRARPSVPKARPPAPLGSIPKLGRYPGAQQAVRDRKRVAKTQPQRPTPYVPVVRHPTRQQTAAAKALIVAEVNRRVGNHGTGAERNARRKQVLQQIQDDPRQARFRQAINHYAVKDEQQTAQLLGRHLGVKGKRAQIQAGRQLAQAQRQRDIVRPGRGPKVATLGPASVNLTAVSRGIQGVTSLNTGDIGPRNIVKNTGRDLVALGTGPFIGGYTAAHGTYRAATGHGTGELEQLGKGILQGITDSVPGYLVRGDLKGASRSFHEHPLFAALDVAAGVGTVGRVSGTLARASKLGGSTVRPPLALVNDAAAARSGLLHERSYSKDLTRKAVQVAQDARRRPVLDADGNAVTVTQRGHKVPVLQAKTTGFRKSEQVRLNESRADFTASRANSAERMARDAVAKEAHKTGRIARGKAGKLADEVRVMAVEGTIRTADSMAHDLRAHAARIREQLAHPENYRTKAEFEAAKARAQFAEDVASHPKVLAKAQRLFEVAHQHAEQLNAADREAVKRGVLSQEVADRSRLMTYAIEHMGARHVTAEEHARLEKAASSPEEALAVSGRDPRKFAAHVKAREQKVAVRKRVNAARERVRRAEAAVARGDETGRVRLEQARVALRDVKKEYTQARKVAAKTPMPKARDALRTEDGRFLSNEDIAAHARAAGRDPDTLAYVPHRMEESLRTSHHTEFRPGSRPNFAKGETRTGSLYRRGATSHSKELIRDELTRKATQLAKTDQLDRQIQDLGLRHPAWAKAEKGGELSNAEKRIIDKGGYFTPKEAAEYAKRAADAGEDLIPVRAYPATIPKKTQQMIRGEQNPGALETLDSRLFNDRLNMKDGTRNVVLLPKPYVDRLARQLAPKGELNRFFQLLNAPFRMAVLPQPRWLTGNLLEPYVVRLTMNGSGVNVFGLGADIRAANKVLKSLENGTKAERAAAKELKAQQLGGLFVGRKGATVRRTYEDFTGATRNTLYAGHVLRNLPVVKQMADMVLSLPHAFFAVNRVIESGAQRAALGNTLRKDIQEFTGSWAQTVALGDKAIQEARRGLTNTATQHRFMVKQHELLGKYEGFSPGMRTLVQGPMPFLPWSLNAARFVYVTMPLHHTIATDLLIKSSQVVQDQWDTEHADVPPGGLKLAQITAKGGLVDIARYTPYGFSGPISGGDLQGVTDSLLPQLSGIKSAAEGQDPFGRPLQVPKTPENPRGQASGGQKALIAINNFFEATVPLLAQARRLREGGGTGYGNSNIFSPKVKPDSKHMSAVRRVYDPFRPTYLKEPVERGGKTPSSALDPGDQHDIREAIKGSQLDPADLEDIRQAIREAAGG